jgi:lauroyl/myristoyl acyltransferase
MSCGDNDENIRSETFYSQALLTGEFTAQEETGRRERAVFDGTRVKVIVLPKLLWLLRHAPAAIVMLPVQLAVLPLRALYWLPRNPLRQSCESICRIAGRTGYSYRPGQVYQRFLSNFAGAIKNFARLYSDGYESALGRIHLSAEDSALINRLAEEHGGILLMAPHNFDGVFSMVRFQADTPLLMVVRNPASIERTRIALDVYERMRVKIMMVRGGNPFEVSRCLFSILKTGQAVAAPVDVIDRSGERVEVDMFGGRIGFSPWAAKIAARRNIPVLPIYVKHGDDGVLVTRGEPLISGDVAEIIQHYANFFERNILQDPASWAFLSHKDWIKALRRIGGD